MVFPRLIISALRGGSGKTLISLGLIAALRKRGIITTPFKKGPDYIDAGWLALTAGQPCYNLDTFFASKEGVLSSFIKHAACSGISIIEGNRGLYDGIDLDGNTSTSELAKLLNTPAILSIDCTKSTRTVAALVLGCLRFDSDVMIEGVVLNRIAGSRHEQILRRSIEHYTGVRVLGAIPKLKHDPFPERHMGLIPTQESPEARHSIKAVGDIAEKYLDIVGFLEIASRVPEISVEEDSPDNSFRGATGDDGPKPRIGIVQDSAFQFYYPENMEALRGLGADIVSMSALAERCLPDIDGLYIGGGFPETHAEPLAANASFREDLRRLAEDGLPVYAECGGLMYLGRSLTFAGKVYPMTGVLPVEFGFSKRPQGHGYTIITVDRPNPYFAVGTRLKGHEFHYSTVLKWEGDPKDLAFEMERGSGFMQGRDGVCYKNVLATYTHVHAFGFPCWAEALVHKAKERMQNVGKDREGL